MEEMKIIRRISVWASVIALLLAIVVGILYGQQPSSSMIESLAYICLVSACGLSALSPVRIFADESFIPIMSKFAFILAAIFFLIMRPVQIDIWGKLLLMAGMVAGVTRIYAELHSMLGLSLKHR